MAHTLDSSIVFPACLRGALNLLRHPPGSVAHDLTKRICVLGNCWTLSSGEKHFWSLLKPFYFCLSISGVLAPAAMTRYRKLGGWNNGNLFLPVRESGDPNQGASRVGVWWGLSPWVADSCLPAVSSHGMGMVLELQHMNSGGTHLVDHTWFVVEGRHFYEALCRIPDFKSESIIYLFVFWTST